MYEYSGVSMSVYLSYSKVSGEKETFYDNMFH